MKQLIKLVSKRLQRWYYYQELRQLSLLAITILTIWCLYTYHTVLLTWVFSTKGMIYVTFSMATLVLAIVIKIYYRMIVIKYHEKDSSIQLFNH